MPLRWLTVIAAASLATGLSAPRQQPQFKSGVEQILVDVQVVDNRGRPVPQLTAADFEVKIGHKIHRITSVEFVRAAEVDTPASGAPLPRKGPATAALSATPALARDDVGRDFILAVDESSFSPGAALSAARAARGFVAHLAPADRVGLFTYPVSPRFFSLTPDHDAVVDRISHISGSLMLPPSEFHLSPSEIVDVTAGDRDTIARVARRECGTGPFAANCAARIPTDAAQQSMAYESQISQSINGLRGLLVALHQDPQRKTVVIISGGMLGADRVSGRPDIAAYINAISDDAAAAGATIYVLFLDSSFQQAFSAANPSRMVSMGSTAGGVSTSLMRETSALELGLDRLAGVAGGTLLHADTGLEELAFERILRETSAYYLLGVEPLEEDRDGRLHPIAVKAMVPGTDVRSRKSVMIPKSGS